MFSSSLLSDISQEHLLSCLRLSIRLMIGWLSYRAMASGV